ncbi:RGS1-HXK1-interacting protein 1 isoform X2 [Ziziphus jujuba]|uniref:RGS1-HXK1-interacting protein 1 isoform X2 n=1 Tax=Ziziphus jujuba TaxID=326968 RepID=A0ABM3IUQ8_ZIZJJ|nr:RGS1-HXK1-interacting protein 1 isoform X2 [Ziziphus jujuba]
MSTVPESSSEGKPTLPLGEYSTRHDSQTLDRAATPWVDYAVEQARTYQKAAQEAVESAIEASRSRLSQIRSTSSAHFQQTVDSLQDVKSEYVTYEELLFGKLKEGILIAASHPMLTGGIAAGLGFLALKRPRRFLYYNTLRLFVSEESMLSRADAKVKELRQSIDLLKAETEKLEKSAIQAEEEMIRGKTKLRHAGKQIRGVIRSAYKIEKHAAGMQMPCVALGKLKLVMISGLASEAKRERNALTKEVTKISNYGISV